MIGLGIPSRLGPATRGLLGALVLTSVASTWAQRRLGMGALSLVYDATAIAAGEVWRLATYPFVALDLSSLIWSCLGLALLGGPLEARWGSRRYARFFALSSLGGAVVGLVLRPLVALLMPFEDPGLVAGPRAAFDAMLVAMAVADPGGRVLVGFVVPMTTRQLIGLLLGLHVVGGIMLGEAAGCGVSVGGGLVGWLLSSGRWRPGRWRRRGLPARRAGHLYAVPSRGRMRDLN